MAVCKDVRLKIDNANDFACTVEINFEKYMDVQKYENHFEC